MGYVSRATRKGNDRRRKGEVSRPEAAFLFLCRHHLRGGDQSDSAQFLA